MTLTLNWDDGRKLWKVDHINNMGRRITSHHFTTEVEARHFRDSLEAALKLEGGDGISMWDKDPKPRSRWERLMEDDDP